MANVLFSIIVMHAVLSSCSDIDGLHCGILRILFHSFIVRLILLPSSWSLMDSDEYQGLFHQGVFNGYVCSTRRRLFGVPGGIVVVFISF